MNLFLQGENCVVCGKAGERHHIVYKSEDGIDFPLNYIYLCSEHHRGKSGPHRNKKIDLTYKLQFQKKLLNILKKEYYSLEELARLLEMNTSHAKTIFKDFRLYKEGYKTSEIIKRLMGGKLYYDVMLDDYYDNSWNILEEFEYNFLKSFSLKTKYKLE